MYSGGMCMTLEASKKDIKLNEQSKEILTKDNKYAKYAKKAELEGYEFIARIFEEFAKGEEAEI
jgi:rubrerythrin